MSKKIFKHDKTGDTEIYGLVHSIFDIINIIVLFLTKNTA